MTDANLSMIFMDEINDTGSYTYLSVKCAAGQGWIFALSTKHAIVPQDSRTDEALDEWQDDAYVASYRVGSGLPATIYDLIQPRLGGKLRPDTLLFYDTNANNVLAQGLNDGQKITLRLEPRRTDAAIKADSITFSRQLDSLRRSRPSTPASKPAGRRCLARFSACPLPTASKGKSPRRSPTW